MELLDTAYVARTGVTTKAVIRQARRVARSAIRVWGPRVQYPAGVVIYMSKSLPIRVQNELYNLGNDGIAEQLSKPLRSRGRTPRIYVRLETDEAMGRPFEVAVLERDHQARPPESDQEHIPPDLVLEVIRQWQALENLCPKVNGKTDLRWLQGRTGLPYPQLDFARHTRNRLAHPTAPEHGNEAGRNNGSDQPPMSYDRVVAALQTMRTAYERLQSHAHDHDDGDRSAGR
jgi:hypothetical protein